MSKSLQQVIDQLLRVSGIGRRRAAPLETTGKTLQIARRRPQHRPELIGELSCEDGVFVFRYEPNYEGPTLPEFPDRDSPHRSETLWPFFEVRLPPTSRKDVQEVMKRIDADDPLEMLAALGGLSVTNPYELRLAGEAPALPDRKFGT